MAAEAFELTSEWRLAAPVEKVWDEIVAVENWPAWWPAVKRVELLEPGDANGVGALRRLTWRTALPYDLAFETRTVTVERLRLIVGRASGELDGSGTWTFRTEGADTLLRYDWRVAVTKPWMRVMAPVLRPVFAWNHNKVMGWGETGIRARLGIV